MKVTVTFRHLDPTPALKTYAIEKLGHVEKLLTKPEQGHWILSVEKKRHTAELAAVANGEKFVAKETGEDLYAAIDLVIGKVAAQARKRKGKRKNHKAAKRGVDNSVRRAADVRMSSLAARGARLADGPEIVRTETVKPPVYGPEEAIAALEVSGKEFLVYVSRDQHVVNIAYRRDDGFFGVIQPEVPGNGNGNGQVPFHFDVWARDEDGAHHAARRIRQREVPVKTMTVQESVAEMNRSRNHFWVYADRARHGVNVVYRTRGGEYGLIET